MAGATPFDDWGERVQFNVSSWLGSDLSEVELKLSISGALSTSLSFSFGKEFGSSCRSDRGRGCPTSRTTMVLSSFKHSASHGRSADS